MEVQKIKVTSTHGLHLRRAADVVNLSKKYKSKIYLCHRCKFADTCSILEVLTLAATKDAEVAIIAEGPDEKEAIKEVARFFTNGAGI
jgi:phosphotransferase system HPr (HPr) family protein